MQGINSLYRTSDRYEKRISFYKNLIDQNTISDFNYKYHYEWKPTYNKLIQRKYRIDKEIEERLKFLEL